MRTESMLTPQERLHNKLGFMILHVPVRNDGKWMIYEPDGEGRITATRLASPHEVKMWRLLMEIESRR